MDNLRLHIETENHVRYEDMIDTMRTRTNILYNIDGCEVAVKSLEDARRKSLEDWMDENGFDCLVSPTNRDVDHADVDEEVESMIHALQDGVKYSNSGSALKHLEVLAITVPMGTIPESGIPVGKTFCGRG
jgi:Asp-tRNA(Asn)/Glu-tRNA(Gln) amidotransferase A subunit family amidase